MNFLKGWPFEPMDISNKELAGAGNSGGGSPG
jgi:hypothetical protein